MSINEVLNSLGINEVSQGACTSEWLDTSSGEVIESQNPTNAQSLGKVQFANTQDYETVIKQAQTTFSSWRMVPAPKRGEVVRQLGEELRKNKEALGKLVSLEMGKIYSEGLGEVQEMIDICDFAVGLSRQLYGSTMHSERPLHRMYEQWHPLGVVGIISAFNFPVAVWAWNSTLAAVCGNTNIWKPSLKTPLTAVAVQNICNKVMKENNCEGVFNLIIGSDSEIGETLINDPRVPLISATGSCRMGRHVGTTVAKRMGRSLLELGGNNAIIVMDDANLELVIPGTLFGAVGTSGQRCTSTRRLLVHEKVYDEVKTKLIKGYQSLFNRIGDPLDPETIMGPVIDDSTVSMFETAIDRIQGEGGKILVGGKRYTEGNCNKGFFLEPTLVEAKKGMPILKEETFAPILYLVPISGLEEAIEIQNGVSQGLSSSIFTTNVLHAESFLSHQGSDCGIANVNIGTSGAEIGGAFGGEKETGGGREAGSDSWKAYMRRQTNTINWSTELPLAQGVKFS